MFNTNYETVLKFSELTKEIQFKDSVYCTRNHSAELIAYKATKSVVVIVVFDVDTGQSSVQIQLRAVLPCRYALQLHISAYNRTS